MKKRFWAAAYALAITAALSTTVSADAGLTESGALNEGLLESGALNEGLLENGALNEGLLGDTSEESRSDPVQTAVVTALMPDTGVHSAVGALTIVAATSLGIAVATRKRK